MLVAGTPEIPCTIHIGQATAARPSKPQWRTHRNSRSHLVRIGFWYSSSQQCMCPISVTSDERRSQLAQLGLEWSSPAASYAKVSKLSLLRRVLSNDSVA